MPAPLWGTDPHWPGLSGALGAAAFSPDVLNVSCSSCPSLLGLREGLLASRGRRSAAQGPGNAALSGDITRGMSPGAVAGPGWAWPPHGAFSSRVIPWVTVQKGIPWEPFYCSHLYMTLM